MPMLLQIVYRHFLITPVELGSFDIGYVACKTEDIYYLAINRLLTPNRYNKLLIFPATSQVKFYGMFIVIHKWAF